MAHRIPCGRLAKILFVATLTAAAASCRSTADHRSQEPGVHAADDFSYGSERGPTVKTLQSVAHIMAAQGRDAECEEVLLKLVDTHPRFLPAYNELAELYMRNDELESAEAILNAGLEVEPTDSVLLNNLGMTHLVRGEYEDALASFTKAAEADPDDARCRANMASCLGMLGRLEEALSLFYQVVPPKEAHYNLGVIAEAIGDSARAEEEFKIARKL